MGRLRVSVLDVMTGDIRVCNASASRLGSLFFIFAAGVNLHASSPGASTY